MSRMLAAVVTAALSVISLSARAEQLRDLQLSRQPTELLDGRLKVRLPKDARVVAPRPLEKPQLQSEVHVGAGGSQMAVVAQELLALAPNEFMAAVHGMVTDPDRVRVEKFSTQGSSLLAYAVWPSELETGAEANLVVSLFLARKDRTVMMVGFFVNGTAAADPGGARVLAKRIARTLEAGSKTLPIQGGKIRLKSPSGATVTLRLPRNTVMTAERGTAGSFYTFHRLVLLGQPHAGNLAIQLGGKTELKYRRYRAEPRVAEAPLLGERTKWYRWKLPTADATIVEAATVARVGRQDLPVHVFLTADGTQRLAAWQEVVDTLQPAL